MIRTGLTFIEVVISLAILALAVSMTTGAFSYLEVNAMRDVHRVNAMEVAHRVIIEFIDNKERLEDQVAKVGPYYEYAGFRYRFDYREEILERGETADPSDVGGLTRREARDAREADIESFIKDRLIQIVVEVRLDEPGHPLNSGRPLARLIRMDNPLEDDDSARVIDRILNLVEEEQARREESRRNRQNQETGQSGEQPQNGSEIPSPER